MAYSVEVLAGEPVVILRMDESFNFEQDLSAVHEEIARRINLLQTPRVFRITDFSALSLAFNELQSFLYLETRGGPGSFADDRTHSVFVGTGEWVQMAADSLVQLQYGKIPAQVFSTVNEALVYVRATLSHASDK